MVNRFFRDIQILKRMNWLNVVAVGLLVVIGILFIYSACCMSEEQLMRSLYKKQMLWAAAGVLCYLSFAAYDYRRFWKISWWVYGTVVLMLILVLFVGTKLGGAKRWLPLLPQVGLGIQPSELAKLATIIVLARIMSRPGSDLHHIKYMLIIMATVLVPMMLVIKEPDLGTALIFVPLTFIMMFIGGISLRILGVLSLVGVTVVMLFLGALFLPEQLGMSKERQQEISNLTGLGEYQQKRIVTFFQPEKDPLGAGWNKMQSEIAVGSGGAWGKGFKNGRQNILGFLPRKVAPTDFIYSVIAEEKGFMGSVVVLSLFGALVVFGMRTACIARDRMGRFLCVGIITMIFCHVFINIAMAIGLMPITGLPLPLLSYGGSFMVVTMSALGIVQSVYIRSCPMEQRFL
ncbi:rod shape-determining protein RodA [Verrucomicrobiota bacterium]